MVITLDAQRMESREQAHQYLREQLGLPEHYGGNLDALYDCLTELGEETVLRVTHQEALAEKLGSVAQGLFQVLKDAEMENPWLRVEV